MFKDALTERMKWGLGSVTRSGSQFDSISQMSSTHSKECAWIQVVQHKLHIFGSPFVVIGVANQGGDAELPVRTVLYKWWSGVSVTWESIDKILVGAVDNDWWGWQPDALE
jgi:hypothetical protein